MSIHNLFYPNNFNIQCNKIISPDIINTAENVGDGSPLSQIATIDNKNILELKTLKAGSNITLISDSETITINSSSSGVTGATGPTGETGPTGGSWPDPLIYVNTSPYNAIQTNAKYITNFTAGTMLFTLPATAQTGDEITVSTISSVQGIEISGGGSNIFIMNGNVTPINSALVNFADGINNSSITFIYLVTNTANNFWIPKSMTCPYYDPITQQYIGYRAPPQIIQPKYIYLNASAPPNLTDGYISQSGLKTTISEAAYMASEAITIKKFTVLINIAPNAHSWTFDLIVNGINTALTVVLSGASSTTGYTTGNISLSALDNFAIKVTKGGGPPPTTACFCTIEYI